MERGISQSNFESCSMTSLDAHAREIFSSAFEAVDARAATRNVVSLTIRCCVLAIRQSTLPGVLCIWSQSAKLRGR